MTTNNTAKRIAGTIVALTALVCTSAALGAPGVAPAPLVPGAHALGPAVDTGKPAASIQLLTAKPEVAKAGSDFTITGSGLPANKDVVLTWSTATVDWVLDARPDSVDYLGRKATKYNVQLAVGHTDAAGALNVTVKAPEDW